MTTDKAIEELRKQPGYLLAVEINGVVIHIDTIKHNRGNEETYIVVDPTPEQLDAINA